MSESIEKTFFDAFKIGGVVSNCIIYIANKYDLGYKPQDNCMLKINECQQNFFNVVLPEHILKETEAFDDSVMLYSDNPLFDEIRGNIDKCLSDIDKKRYLFSLLTPFAEIADVFYPTANVNHLNKQIRKFELTKKHWEAISPDRITYSKDGCQSETPINQILSCDNLIASHRGSIERLHYISSRFFEIINQWEFDKASVEYCFLQFFDIMVLYQKRLDALLLTYGIDLMRLQEESGIYLKMSRLISDVESIIGTRELSQKYIDALPRLEPRQSNNNTINTNHNSMNYKLIVLNAYTEHRKQNTPYQSYFKREARIAERDHFVEFLDYFSGCQHVLESYKNEIIRQYDSRLTENDWVVSSVKSGNGMKFGDEHVTDESDERIQDSLYRIAEDVRYVKSAGYINTVDYVCCLTDMGEISTDIWERNFEQKLYWQDIIQIEQGFNSAKDELSVQDQKNIIETKNTKIELTEYNTNVNPHCS